MKPLRLILPSMILAMLYFATCAFAQDVSFNFDMTADFTKYKTYHWEKHPNSKDLDDLMMSQLGAALDAELAKKGLTKKTDGTSDLAIVYQVAVKQEKELSTFSIRLQHGAGLGARLWRILWRGRDVHFHDQRLHHYYGDSCTRYVRCCFKEAGVAWNCDKDSGCECQARKAPKEHGKRRRKAFQEVSPGCEG